MVSIRAYWHSQDKIRANFGDALTPIIIRSISGISPESVEFSAANKYLCCGSIINAAKDNDQIWGSGAIIPEQILEHKSKYICHMARGTLSRDVIRSVGIRVPDFACDPAVLIPFIYDVDASPCHDIGIFPHVCSYDRFLSADKRIKNVPVFDVTSGIKSVIKNIKQSKVILTESLHIMIVAEACGIPTIMIQTWTGHKYDFTWKFRDYYSTTGRTFIDPILWFEAKDLDSEINQALDSWRKPDQVDYEKLFQCCPFNFRNISNPNELIKGE